MGYLFVALAALLWGSLGPVARAAFEAGVSPLELAFWRASIAGVCFAAHAAVRGRFRIARGDVAGLVLFAFLGVTVFYWSYLRAVDLGGAALAAVLLYTAPAWVALGAAIWLGERFTARALAALVLALAGVALVAFGGGGDTRVSAAAIAWGLVSGLSYAAYYLFGKRYFARYATPTLFLYALPIGALSLLPAVRFAPKSAAAWGAILFIAVVPTYLAYLLYAHGLRRVEATRAAMVATLEPVVAAVAAYVAWGERLGVAGTIGGALVLGGVLVATTRRGAPDPPHEGPAPTR
ncbi:MAG TPA: EamA family transporter [Gemmatimonadaceae bacterium]